MRKALFGTSLIAAVLLCFAATAPASTLQLPWINGDFALGELTWSYPGSTSFVDADNDGDLEARLVGIGEGSWQLSRGATKGDVPAIMNLEFDVEKGSIAFHSFRMILLSPSDPDAWANNLLNLSPALPTYDDDYWFDDQVLAWEDWSNGPLTGHVVLDPTEAKGFNIPGWDTMTKAQRSEFLSTALHMTLVVYGYAQGYGPNGDVATIDNFAWSI